LEARAKHHKSVKEVAKPRFLPPGYVEERYFRDPVIVHCSPDEQAELGKSSMEAYELAQMMLQFWKTYTLADP